MATLENVSTEDLRDVLSSVDSTDAAIRVMAAITYKEVEGITQKEIGEMYGFSTGWVSKWFRRLEEREEGALHAVVSDRPRSGRPPELSGSDVQEFAGAVRGRPEDVGLNASAWTVSLATEYLRERFDVEYSTRHVRRLLIDAGLTWKPARENDASRTREMAAAGRTIWVPADDH